MRNAEAYARASKRSEPNAPERPQRSGALLRSGQNVNRRREPAKTGGSRYYPEIASLSPQFVGI